MDKTLRQLFIDSLASIGEEAIKEAYSTREFTNRTFNLKDSYGSAVYLDGQLLKETIRYIGPSEAKVKRYGLSGREEIYKFFNEYSPNNKGCDVVVAASMPYARELELGLGLKHKYRVIVGAREILERIASRNGLKLKGLGALS